MSNAGDRRPIAARDSGAVQRLAAWLILRRASANGISLLGMAAALLAGICFACVPSVAGPAWALWVWVRCWCSLRLLANLLDGMVALGPGVASPLGELFNEVPDRVSDTAILRGLGTALAAMGRAYLRVVDRAAGAPSDFRGRLAKPHRMALVILAALWCAVALAWASPVPAAALWIILIGASLMAARRLMSPAHALRRSN